MRTLFSPGKCLMSTGSARGRSRSFWSSSRITGPTSLNRRQIPREGESFLLGVSSNQSELDEPRWNGPDRVDARAYRALLGAGAEFHLLSRRSLRGNWLVSRHYRG